MNADDHQFSHSPDAPSMTMRAMYNGQRARSWSTHHSRGVFQLVLAISALLVASCANPLAHAVVPPPSRALPNSRSNSGVQRNISGQRSVSAANAGGWTTFGGNLDSGSLGGNAVGQATTITNINRLHLGWTVQLPELADERPILARNLTMSDGKLHDVLYLTTDHGTLLALDAVTGKQFWSTTPKTDNPVYTKASPVADPVHNLVYSYGLDGKVHRFRANTGKEVLGGGWPVLVTQMKRSEKVSSALNLANGYLYVTTASFSGDAPPYQGHLVAINVDTGDAHVFNSLCNDHTHLMAQGECTLNGGGIWGRPGVNVDPVTGHIYLAVSDGIFDVNKGGHDWGDSVVEMTADGSKVLDSYTPTNYEVEAFQNRDLGSTTPVLLPKIPSSSTPYLAVQVGKEGLVRLLNRQNLSGQGSPGHVGGELQTVELQDLCPALAQPVTWTDPASGNLWLFVATLCHFDAFRVDTSPQGVTRLKPAWKVSVDAASPIVVSGTLFAAASQNLVALDPRTGHQVWSSALASTGGNIDRIHWESPIFVNGRLYCADEVNQLHMYQL